MPTTDSGASIFHRCIRPTTVFLDFQLQALLPLSVALFRYAVYLVEILESWWCPFVHDQKQEYAAAIDEPFWHVDPGELIKLHPDDKRNPIWFEKEEPLTGGLPYETRI